MSAAPETSASKPVDLDAAADHAHRGLRRRCERGGEGVAGRQRFSRRPARRTSVVRLCRLRARPVRSIAQSHGVIAMDMTYYVALPFVLADDGVAGLAKPWNARAPTRPSCGPRCSRESQAAPARSRSAGQGIRRPENFSDATLTRKFGDVPDDLSAREAGLGPQRDHAHA